MLPQFAFRILNGKCYNAKKVECVAVFTNTAGAMKYDVWERWNIVGEGCERFLYHGM